jgi:hypothetical protein
MLCSAISASGYRVLFGVGGMMKLMLVGGLAMERDVFSRLAFARQPETNSPTQLTLSSKINKLSHYALNYPH